MQRAQEKETLAKATAASAEENETKKAAEQWVVGGEKDAKDASADGKTCADEKKEKIIVTYAPRSAFISRGAPARVSFGGRNKQTENAMVEKIERERKAKAIANANKSKAADVSDVEMAAKLSKNTKGYKRPPPLESSLDKNKPKK